ncbi:MAG: hypothetical protein H8E28_08525 [Anaerolineae bacterium]|nr:hypothetical protein [Anaerolineae bacterium]
MQNGKGRITEIIYGFDDSLLLRVDCPSALLPAPGQYLLADDGLADSVLAVPLFRAGTVPEVILQSSTPMPRHWLPGLELHLRGPLGHGFNLPAEVSHIALTSLGGGLARLLPLIGQNPLADIAIFTDAALPDLPVSVEVRRLADLPEALPWADFLALELTIEILPKLRTILGLAPHERPVCTAQALIISPMPCGALAECGVCAVPARKGYKLACKDGPVLDLKQLQW